MALFYTGNNFLTFFDFADSYKTIGGHNPAGNLSRGQIVQDSDHWPAPAQYSAIYVPSCSTNVANLAESSFSTTSTSDHQVFHSSSSSGGREKKCRAYVATAGRHSRGHKQPQPTLSSSCSCSSCSSCPEDNASLMLANKKENSKSADSDLLLWQTMQNNAGTAWVIPPSTASMASQNWQPQNHLVTLQSQNPRKESIFSSLWRKKPATRNLPAVPACNKTASAASPRPARTGNQGWMTLRVPTHQDFMHQPPSRTSLGLLQMQPPPIAIQSKTLPNNNNGGQQPQPHHSSVMPNPDDILPKEAWTDFSGTDEWPRFTGINGLKTEAEDHVDNALYVNSEATTGLSEANGNSFECNKVISKRL